MTLSVDDRRQFATLVLRRMAEEVGLDREYPSVHFPVSDPKFADVPSTTWIELKDYRRVKLVSHPNGPAYRLTGSGWVEGLDAADGEASDDRSHDQRSQDERNRPPPAGPLGRGDCRGGNPNL